jgi:putative SOS response-associated peptidase YedK
MCYHYTVPDIDVLERHFHAKLDSPKRFARIYHISGFVKPQLPVITGDDTKRIKLLTWGLIPHWVKDEATANNLRTRTLNARAETIHEKPAFRSLIKSRRCLILTDGFFEWRHYQGKTYPHYIQLKNQQPFTFAGLWDSWAHPETEEKVKTFTIITTWANPLLEQVHNKRKRMPVILHQSDENPWLTFELDQEAINDLLVPYEADQMTAHPVSRLITTRGAKTNIPDAIKPVDYPELPSI